MTADSLPDPAAPLAVRMPATAGRLPSDATDPDSADDIGQTPAPPAELLVAARFDVRPGYHVRRDHGAPSWLLAWTLAGAGWFRQGGARVDAMPGDLVVLGSGLPHSYAVAEAAGLWSFWWVHCPPRTAWHTWLARFTCGDRLYRVGGHPDAVRARIGTTFRRLHADARWSGHGVPAEPVASTARNVPPAVAASSPGRELACSGVEEVLVLATAAVGPEHGQSPTAGLDPRVRRVEALVVADPAAPHTVRSLADQVALSPSRLAHLFVAQTGRTPMQALRDARLRHAARLLDATDLPVASVAVASGFASPFHFSRLFRDRFGVPPTSYRTRRHGTAPESNTESNPEPEPALAPGSAPEPAP
jgi:AraC family transcriptional regulator of arabinose operon